MFTTKLLAMFGAGLFGVFALSGSAPAEPYAPMAKDPGKPTIEGKEAEYPLEQMMLQATAKNIPDRSAVKQPPYPGAVVVTAQPASKGSMNGVAFTTLPAWFSTPRTTWRRLWRSTSRRCPIGRNTTISAWTTCMKAAVSSRPWKNPVWRRRMSRSSNYIAP